ncbi:hypothetical protein Tco_0565411 [Tanacetum coccineum]
MEKIILRRHLGSVMDTLSLRYAFWVNQCTSGFHRLDEPGGSRVHLKLVLELLKKEKLFAKLSKYEFWLQEVRFLGHVVNINDVHVDSSEASKVENAIAEMLRGLDQLMERKEDGGMYFIWVSLIGDVRTLIMDEAHASRGLKYGEVGKAVHVTPPNSGMQRNGNNGVLRQSTTIKI